MSALRAVAKIATPRQFWPRPKLDVIEGGATDRGRFALVRAPLHARSSVPFALLCAGILSVALAGVLLLNTRMIDGSYELARLQREVTRTGQDVQVLHEQLRAAQAALPVRAAGIGMVPAQQPEELDVAPFAPAVAPDEAPIAETALDLGTLAVTGEATDGQEPSGAAGPADLGDPDARIAGLPQAPVTFDDWATAKAVTALEIADDDEWVFYRPPQLATDQAQLAPPAPVFERQQGMEVGR